MEMLIKGDSHIDKRGIVKFVNDFDMTKVVRMYAIEPEKEVIRAWQGHRKETKWFFLAKGSLLLKTINMDNHEDRKENHLTAQRTEVLEVPGGFFNGFQALEEETVLMVFSDYHLEQSINDDHRANQESIPWILQG